MGHSKRGQNWSIEFMVAMSIFVVIFIFSTIFIFYTPVNDIEIMEKESEKAVVGLETHLELVEDDKVDEEKLDEIITDNLSSSELATVLGISGDVCISFEDLDGNLTVLSNGEAGIGIDGNMICGGSE
ncbi:MAG: hypothetical protein ACQER9_03425 [Nanobdellota archaeon]